VRSLECGMVAGDRAGVLQGEREAELNGTFGVDAAGLGVQLLRVELWVLRWR
jgi:hypothetical protein